jgi:hypothetical protein
LCFPDEIGSGLAVFHPKGGIIRKAMEDYSRRRHEEEDYEFVYSPHITKGTLFEVSGHLDWYREGMYPKMHLDAELNEDGTVRKPGQDYYLKPMNCPMHNLIFRSRGRSYRELPLRIGEIGGQYRAERSGVLGGLSRVRVAVGELAVQPEVDVQRHVALVVVQQVFAVGGGVEQDPAVDAARTVGEASLRAADRHGSAGEQGAVPPGEAVDGVTFRHPNVYTRHACRSARYSRRMSHSALSTTTPGPPRRR